MRLEIYANSLYSHQPDIQVVRWQVPGYPIIVGGSLIDAADYQHLVDSYGVRGIVNVETEHDDTGKVPPELLCQQQVPDDGALLPEDKILAVIRFARKHSHSPLYVHCQMGGSRSPAFAYAILRGVHGLSRDDALAAINEGFKARKAGTADTESAYGWHPVHKAYLASIDALGFGFTEEKFDAPVR